MIFREVANQLNFPEIERQILKFWEENNIFAQYKEKNKDKKKWSFQDGPITANGPMGVHHAWDSRYLVDTMATAFLSLVGLLIQHRCMLVLKRVKDIIRPIMRNIKFY